MENLLKKAGFELLGVFDAESWKAPTKKTTRVDFVAIKAGGPTTKRDFEKVLAQVRGLVYAQ